MGMTREERLHATMWSDTEPPINDTEHAIDQELLMDSEDEIKVWGYLMMQYNLKPGLRKFGEKGAKAAMDKLTQLHMMDTWMAMDPFKITREDRMQALSSLLFLKEKQTGKRVAHASMEHLSVTM
jgi:hypothetical protein